MRNFKNTIIFIIAIVLLRVLVELPKAISLTNQVTNASYASQDIDTSTAEPMKKVDTSEDGKNLTQKEKDLIDSDKNTKAGYSFYNEGKYEIALGYAEIAIEFNNKNSEAYNLKGISRTAIGDLENIIDDYNKAIQYNPNYAEAYYNRGEMRYEAGHYNEALLDLQRARTLAIKQANKGLQKATDALIRTIKENQ